MTEASPQTTPDPLDPHGERRVLFIEASTDYCDQEDLYPEDRAVPGLYIVDVPAHMDAGTAAACAMGGFHSSIPIKRLYDFEFVVYDAEADDDTEVELIPRRDLDWYDLATQCGKVFPDSDEDSWQALLAGFAGQ